MAKSDHTTFLYIIRSADRSSLDAGEFRPSLSIPGAEHAAVKRRHSSRGAINEAGLPVAERC